jgi:hypothetical protein
VCTVSAYASIDIFIGVQYIVPQAVANSSVGCPVASTSTPQRSLPRSTPLCATLGFQLLEPPASLQLESDREQQFVLRAPGMWQVLHDMHCLFACILPFTMRPFMLRRNAVQNITRDCAHYSLFLFNSSTRIEVIELSLHACLEAVDKIAVPCCQCACSFGLWICRETR